MRILLCGPIQKDAEIQNWGAPCLGVMRIAEYVRNSTYDETIQITLYDSQIDRFDPIDKWKEEKIDILGVSLLHYTLFDSLVFMKKWKEIHPESLIVVGGNEAGANYQDIFEKSSVDIAVTAEGEKSFYDIIRWKLGKIRLEDIEGIIYRKYAKPITDEMLWDYCKDVDFSRYRYQDYWKQIASMYQEPDYEKINYVRLMTVSHCQRKCTFCSLPSVRTTACGEFVKPASLTGFQIMGLIHKVHEQLPEVRTVYFCTDDVFYPSRTNFLDFIGLYKKSGYDYRLLIQTSTYSLREEDFKSLVEINCQHITIGFENCSESVRESLQKPQKQKKMEDIIKWGKKYRIQIYVLIILMPPETTMKDLMINYETLSRWVLEDGVQISVEPVMYPYRGAPIFNIDGKIHYETREQDGIEYRDAKWVMPDDQEVRSLCWKLIEDRDTYVEDYLKGSSGHRHKGNTGVALVSLLGKLLRERCLDYSYKGL